MSMLGMQADELRKTADMAANLDDFERVSIPWMRNKLAPMLREAADTIISLRDRLQAVQGINGESNYDKLFGTPEQAIAATLGTPISADLRTALDFMRIWITDDAHLGESAISRELEKAEGLRKLDAIEQAIVATLGRGTCKLEETEWVSMQCPMYRCSRCNGMFEDGRGDYRYCPYCGARVEKEGHDG